MWKPTKYRAKTVGVNTYWQEVERRDHGICAKCGLNTFTLWRALQYVYQHCDGSLFNARWTWWPLTFKEFSAAVGPNAYRFPGPRLYEIHHKRTRVQKGSDALANLETLCRECHLLETVRQREAGELVNRKEAARRKRLFKTRSKRNAS